MFNPGDGAIFVGAYSSHGGRVVSGQANYIVHGKQVAVVGDMVACPVKGHGVCPIVEGHPTITVNGKSVAFDGCHTACGPTLISSMNGVHALGDDRQPSAQAYYDTAVSRPRQSILVLELGSHSPIRNRLRLPVTILTKHWTWLRTS
ncbi:PAAR domain-containing protein [Halomonas litopenaei]|nr:PAAR domain-containing protein [Halomonas litopenaei]